MGERRAPSLANIPGVVSEEPDGAALRLSVSGSPQAVLAELGRQRVVSIQTREPDLEQVFLGLYGVQDPR